jgi:2-oxoglutarate dehydrogenase E2 component (dihydrolipoamide succinyltransferase)
MGTPIINLPQTGKHRFILFGILYANFSLTNFALAVLGLHAIKDKPVAVNGKVEIRPVRYYSLAMFSSLQSHNVLILTHR